MPGKTLEIIGVFWKGHRGCENMHPFTGDIVVSDDGSFVGFFRDHGGSSSIKGAFKKGLLEFNKQYNPAVSSSDAIDGNVRYTLRAEILMAGDPIVGGWKGTYKVSSCDCKDFQEECNHLIGEDRYGEAALSIFVV